MDSRDVRVDLALHAVEVLLIVGLDLDIDLVINPLDLVVLLDVRRGLNLLLSILVFPPMFIHAAPSTFDFSSQSLYRRRAR